MIRQMITNTNYWRDYVKEEGIKSQLFYNQHFIIIKRKNIFIMM